MCVFLSLLCLLSLFSVFSGRNIVIIIKCKLASLFFNSQVILGSQFPFFLFHCTFYVISTVVLCRGTVKLLLSLNSM